MTPSSYHQRLSAQSSASIATSLMTSQCHGHLLSLYLVQCQPSETLAGTGQPPPPAFYPFPGTGRHAGPHILRLGAWPDWGILLSVVTMASIFVPSTLARGGAHTPWPCCQCFSRVGTTRRAYRVMVIAWTPSQTNQPCTSGLLGTLVPCLPMRTTN